jgi:hypothetical protein
VLEAQLTATGMDQLAVGVGLLCTRDEACVEWLDYWLITDAIVTAALLLADHAVRYQVRWGGESGAARWWQLMASQSTVKVQVHPAGVLARPLTRVVLCALQVLRSEINWKNAASFYQERPASCTRNSWDAKRANQVCTTSLGDAHSVCVSERERVDLVGSHARWKRPCLQTAHTTI